jgi:hypothetical protein
MGKYIVIAKGDRIVLGWAYPTEVHYPEYDADGAHYIKTGEGTYLHVETEAENDCAILLAYPFVEKRAKEVAEQIGGKVEFIP